MIAITAAEFDPLGVLIVERPGQNSQVDEARRRLSRSATLDGGVVVYDGGAASGDRDLAIEVLRATLAQVETAQRLVERYPQVRVSLRDGSFLGAPESYTYRDGTLILRILLLSKTSE